MDENHILNHFSTRLVAVASGPGRYADVHAVVRAGEGLGSAVELVVCVIVLVSRGQGTQTSGVAYVVASEIEDRADEEEAVEGGQENDDAFACVA